MKRSTKWCVVAAVFAGFFSAEAIAFAEHKRYPKAPKQHFKRTKTFSHPKKHK